MTQGGRLNLIPAILHVSPQPERRAGTETGGHTAFINGTMEPQRAPGRAPVQKDV